MESNTEHNCSRSACQEALSLRYGFYRIWNNPGSEPEYRDYCVRCGRKIIEYNKSDAPGGIILKYEIHHESKG